jgi:hypothetical protein
MHPIIMGDLIKARTSDLHRQAERDALGRAARRARQAPAKHSRPFMPAHCPSSCPLMADAPPGSQLDLSRSTARDQLVFTR